MLDTRIMICRGKRKDNGEWVEGYYAGYDLICPNEPEDTYNATGDYYGMTPYVGFVEVDPETVGQWTGLYDNTKWEDLTKKEREEFTRAGNFPSEWKGKKIFGGDVFEWGYAGDRDLRYVIVYDAKLASFVGQRGAGSIRLTGVDIEVIGNIYDNPELLKEEI